MVDLTTTTAAVVADRQSPNSYLWGQKSTGPVVETRFLITDFMSKNLNGHYFIGSTVLSWFSNASALQVGNGAVWGVEASNANEIEIGSNYYQSVAGTYKYSATGKARLIRLRDTEMGFYRAAAGVAAGTITWLQDVTIDDSGNFLVKGVGSLGYGTGAGGAVTQATSRTTGVTLNKRTGQITMNNAALAANTMVGFTLTNSEIAATDVVAVNIKSGATASSYVVTTGAVAAGSCLIELRNTSGGALGEAVVLSFVVIKGVAA